MSKVLGLSNTPTFYHHKPRWRKKAQRFYEIEQYFTHQWLDGLFSQLDNLYLYGLHPENVQAQSEATSVKVFDSPRI